MNNFNKLLLAGLAAGAGSAVAYHGIKKLRSSSAQTVPYYDNKFCECIARQAIADFKARDCSHPQHQETTPSVAYNYAGIIGNHDSRRNFNVGQTTTATIDYAKNDHSGFIVTLDDGGKAFLPRSLASVYEITDDSLVVGKMMAVKVIEVDGRFVKVNRVDVEREELKHALGELKQGEEHEVLVCGMHEGTALVKLGELHGFVDKSELSWNTLENSEQIAKVGKTLKVQIMSIDDDELHFHASVKRLERQPDQVIGFSTMKIGEVYDCEISGIAPYGAFVKVEGGHGLIHISELTQGFVKSVADIVSVGQHVKAKVVLKNEIGRRIGFSLKALENTHAKEAARPTEKNTSAKPENISFTRLGLREDKHTEFKTSIVHSSATHQLGSSQCECIAKTTAAFMNCDGGDLYLGVNDAGEVVGIDRDFPFLESVVAGDPNAKNDQGYRYKPNLDGYVLKVESIIRFYLGNYATGMIDIEPITDRKTGVVYIVVHVAASSNRIIYCGKDETVYVRGNASVRKLTGTDLTAYILTGHKAA